LFAGYAAEPKKKEMKKKEYRKKRIEKKRDKIPTLAAVLYNV